MTETALMVFLSMIIGTFLAQFFILPGFDSLFGFELKFDYSSSLMWLFYLILFVFIILLSGTYPSIYVSSFHPTEIFRSHVKFNSKNTLTKSLLALQFFLTFIAIVVGLLFIANESYMKQKDIGYSKDLELTFNSFANEVVTRFDPNRKQSPRFGDLAELGHEGGSFVFELKGKSIKREVDKNDEYLSKLFKNLYIQLPPAVISDIKKIAEIKNEKNRIVKLQKYEEAAALREQEKSIISNVSMKLEKFIHERISEYKSESKYSSSELSKHKELDSKCKEYQQNKEDQIIRYNRWVEASKIEEEKQRAVLASISIKDIFTITDNPVYNYFNVERDQLIQNFEKNVMYLLERICLLRGTSESEFFDKVVNN